jgi:hypothetical protein
MGKKGGGGGGQAPQVNVPAGVYNTIGSTTGLGNYGTALLNPLASMTNWAANLASGGNAGNIPTTQSSSTQAGPNVSFGSSSDQWASSFDPATGLVTFTNTKGPQQQFTQSISQMVGQGTNAGNLPKSILSQWESDFQQHQAGGSAGGTSGGFNPMSGNLPSGVSLDTAMQYYQKATGNAAPDATTAINYFNNAYASSTGNNALGPFLGQGWSAMLTQAGLPAQMKPVEAQTTALANEAAGEGSSLMGQGQSELNMATTGSGLFPSQQAYVTEAQQTGETGAAEELAKLGLSNSTMAPQLKEQADLSAAATAGQLVQGNISAAQNTIALGQASQKIALAGQTLEVGEQQAVFDMYSSIASEGVGFQQNLWNEALAGYGTLGNIIKTSADSYGQSLTGYGEIIQAESASAQNQTALAEASQQSDASSTSSLFGALGKIIGGVGGSLGGAAAGAAGAGAAAGGGGALAGIGGALTALFCQIAQTVYGFDNPKWEKFRAWLLLRAPLWFVRLYGRNAEAVSGWLDDKPALKWCVALAMDLVATQWWTLQPRPEFPPRAPLGTAQ